MARPEPDNVPKLRHYWRTALTIANAVQDAVSRAAEKVQPWKELAQIAAVLLGLIGGTAWVTWPNPQIDPELKVVEADKKAAEAKFPLQCVELRSITDAYAAIGDENFEVKEANFLKHLGHRKLCGRGWAAVWEYSITANDAVYAILRDPNRRNKKIQVRLADTTTSFHEGSPVWVTDATFDVFPKSESVIATNATVQQREVAKSNPVAQKRPDDNKGDTKGADNPGTETRINLGIIELVIPGTSGSTQPTQPNKR